MRLTQTNEIINSLNALLEKDILTVYEDENAAISCLDERDRSPFDSEWVKADKLISGEVAKHPEKKSIEDLTDKYRKLFFDKVIRATGSSDLAAYVSEDFELIVGAAKLSIPNRFILTLLESYEKDIVPSSYSLS